MFDLPETDKCLLAYGELDVYLFDKLSKPSELLIRLIMDYAQFQKQVSLSKQDICREAFADNRNTIRVKKEGTVVKNLERIFDATLKISNKKGFQAMSMRDLSKETNLSMGALYSYFSSKEELLEMLQHQHRTITIRILETYINAQKDPLAKLNVAIRTHLYLSEIMQPWFYFSYMETKNLSKKQQQLAIASELHTEKIISDILNQGQTQGYFQIDDLQLTAGVIKAMLQDWYLKRWKYAKRKISVDQYARFVLNIVAAYISDRKASQTKGEIRHVRVKL
ncbi:MAG: TetR/AcrR family transcriptional regulator [Desulfobacterales bacterium]|jgi:AcrR family transcriptional regulator